MDEIISKPGEDSYTFLQNYRQLSRAIEQQQKLQMEHFLKLSGNGYSNPTPKLLKPNQLSSLISTIEINTRCLITSETTM